MDLFSKELNDRQKEAVFIENGPALVLAGAGSGKTRVLTSRIAHLVIDENIHPSSILAITFTNKAAREMKNRVEKMLGGNVRFPWIGTFHSMCLRMLHRFPESIGYVGNFVIYDMADQKTLVKDCLKELDLDAKIYPPKMAIHHINRSKDEMISAKEFLDNNESDFKLAIIGKIYELYQKRLMENNAMDFGDLIFNTVKMLRENDNIRAYFQSAFMHILVDEYQDTNTAQYELVHILADRHKNIFVVGDDDQSIYGWRGANIRNILDFEKDYPGCAVIRLEQNYRSTTNILAAANDVIKNNTSRKGKTLWTDKGEGVKLNYFKAFNEYNEALFVASQIEKDMEENRKYDDFAVLYRTNAQSRNIEQVLRSKKIPFKTYGGVSYYSRKEVKDILAYMKMLVNSNDNIQLKRIINEPKRGIGNMTIARLEAVAIETGTSMYEVAVDIKNHPVLSSSEVKVTAFVNMVEKLKKAAAAKPPEELFDDILLYTGILTQYKIEKTVESRTRIQNIEELKTAIITYGEEVFEETGEVLTLEAFLESVTLATDVDQEEEGTYVSIMTLHSAKGLEFPVVFITGLEEGIFPSMQSFDSHSRLEEERRLCYVGITRAMDKLYLVNAQQRTLYGRTQSNPDSRFLSEINHELIIDCGYINKQKEEKKYYRKKHKTNGISIMRGGKPISIAGFTAQPGEAVNVNVGQRVKHKKFGEGTVMKTEGQGIDKMIEVQFDMAGKKRLMASYTKLKIID